MTSIELNASERPFVTLMEANAARLMARAQELAEQAEAVKREAEALRNSTYAAIVQRARDEGRLEDVKALKGLPKTIRTEGEPVALQWADQEEPGQKNGTANKVGVELPTS